MPSNPKARKPRKAKPPAPDVQVKPLAESPLADGQVALYTESGQPTKRTPERRAAILSTLESVYISPTKAAEANGISRQTFWLWCKEDLTFSDAIREAQAKFVLLNGAYVSRHARTNPQVAVRIQEAADKEAWERPVMIDIRSVATSIAIEMGLGDDHTAILRLIEETTKLASKPPEGES
jgi:hypothetical protein